jgi:surface antigen
MNMKSVIAVMASGAMLAACQPNGQNPQLNKQNIGTLAGAALGGAAGSRFGKGSGNVASTIAGTLLGGYLGNEVGASLDRADMAYYDRTSQQALESAQPGQSLPWRNPESGNSGTVTPSSYYQTANGQYCREYQQTITIAGRAERGQGTACRQPDGTWQIVN